MNRFSFLFLSVTLAVASAVAQRPVDLVYPLLDAAHSRWFYFSSACRPFGMVSLFPDNQIDEDWDSGYRYEVDTIRDFSHIHEWQLSGVAVMPVTYENEEVQSVMNNCASKFSHDNETVSPGYHSVFLGRYGIKAELTATNRVGVHRYSFPEGQNRGIIFQLSGHLGPSDILQGGFTQTGKCEISGYMINEATSRRPKQAPVYFIAVFNQPIRTIYLQQNGQLQSDAKQWQGRNGKILVAFDKFT